MRNLFTKIGLPLVITVFAFTCTSCVIARPHVAETGNDLKNVSVALRDGGHADVLVEKLRMSYGTSYDYCLVPDWFSTWDWEPHRESLHFYLVVTGTIKPASGRTRKFGWIAPYVSNFSATDYYMKAGALVLSDNEVFLEYTIVPMFTGGAGPRPDEEPFNGNPRLIFKYARYAGTKRHKAGRDGSYGKFSATYKWPVEYLWQEVSKSEFDKGATSGVVIRLDFNNRNDDTRFDQDYYDYYAKRAEPDTERTRFLHAVKSADAAKVEKMLNKNAALIRVYDHDGKTALHLALESEYRRGLLPLLYRFNPDINSVNFEGRTPLHIAALSKAGEANKEYLIDTGGVIFSERWKSGDPREYGLPANVFCMNFEHNGWTGNYAYEALVECPVKSGYYHCNQAAVLAEGKEKIVRELGLSGAPDSLTSRTIEWILDTAEVAHVTYQERADRSSVERSLIRMYGPNLRGLVKEYNESAGRTGPGDTYPDIYSGYCKRCNRDREQLDFLDAARKGDTEKVARMLDRNPDLVHARDDKGKTALHLALGYSNRHEKVLLRLRSAINVIDYKGHTPLHTAAQLAVTRPDIYSGVAEALITLGGRILYPDESFSRFIARGRRSIDEKVINPFDANNGWISDDVYQIWVECTQDCSTGALRSRARERFISDLGLRGAPEESKIQCTIEKILWNMEIACSVKGKPKSRRLVRICAQGLKELVREYHEQKGRPGS